MSVQFIYLHWLYWIRYFVLTDRTRNANQIHYGENQVKQKFFQKESVSGVRYCKSLVIFHCIHKPKLRYLFRTSSGRFFFGIHIRSCLNLSCWDCARCAPSDIWNKFKGRLNKSYNPRYTCSGWKIALSLYLMKANKKFFSHPFLFIRDSRSIKYLFL